MKQQRGWAGAFGADMTKEDEVAKAALAAAKVTEELLAAEDAAMTAAKEPSKRQKQKQKRKQHKQDQKQTEDTSVPALRRSPTRRASRRRASGDRPGPCARPHAASARRRERHPHTDRAC